MSRVVRAAWHAALALGCVAGAAMPAGAAEWSLAPSFSLSADDDSNRALQVEPRATQSTSLSAHAQLERTTETTQFSFTPDVNWQHFDTSAFADILQRDLNGNATWTSERSSLSVTAEDSDQSSLTTEQTQTGVLSSSLHRLLDQASVAGTYGQSERRSLTLSLSYADVRYEGPQSEETDLLSGYRDPSVSLGERVSLSPQAALTATVFASELLTQLPGDDTRQAGGQLDYSRTLSERTQIDVSGGGVSVRSPTGPQTSTIASGSLSHSMSLGTLAVGYSRSLTPYGTGTLQLREQWSLTATRSLTEILDADASFLRVQNGQPLNEPQLGIAIPLTQTYNTLQLGVHWRPAETWTLGAQVSGTQTRAAETNSQTVHEWRVYLSVGWTPHALTRSF